jgi:hypothetical protein
MTSPNKLEANQANAQKSTGPKSAQGKAKSAKNAMLHGLYAEAMVPAAGEDSEAFAALCQAVRERLQPTDAIEGRLADRIALLLWRLDRLTRYDAAVASRAASAAELPPDPDTITSEGLPFLDPRLALAANPATRLAYARHCISNWTCSRDACRAVLLAVRDQCPLRPLTYSEFSRPQRLLEEIVGAQVMQVRDCWKKEGAWEICQLIDRLARKARQDPQDVLCAFQEKLTMEIENYETSLARVIAEELILVEQFRVARSNAQAVTLFADGEAVERVIRLEGHLMRQL